MSNSPSLWARARMRVCSVFSMAFLKCAWRRVKAFLFHQVWCGYVFRILIWIDQGVNVIIGPVLNLMLLLEAKMRRTNRSLIAKFGFPDETLSSVFGKNKNLSLWCGWIAWGLDKIDRGHTDLAMERDEGLFFGQRIDPKIDPETGNGIDRNTGKTIQKS